MRRDDVIAHVTQHPQQSVREAEPPEQSVRKESTTDAHRRAPASVPVDAAATTVPDTPERRVAEERTMERLEREAETTYESSNQPFPKTKTNCAYTILFHAVLYYESESYEMFLFIFYLFF